MNPNRLTSALEETDTTMSAYCTKTIRSISRSSESIAENGQRKMDTNFPLNQKTKSSEPMKKTAVIISGQMRTFAHCLPTQKWQVFRKVKNPTFFVSCADDANAESAELLRSVFPDSEVHIEKVNPPVLPEPPAILADAAPYAITPTKTAGVSAIQGILRQQWHLSRAWKFANEIGLKDYDLFIRCRPDLHFHGFSMPDFVGYESDMGTHLLPTAHTPWWGNCGGVNDRFAVMPHYAAAKAYFETYDNLPKLLEAGCPFHPESLIAASLEAAGVVIKRDLRAEFAFRRLDGSFEAMSIMPGEIASLAYYLNQTSND